MMYLGMIALLRSIKQLDAKHLPWFPHISTCWKTWTKPADTWRRYPETWGRYPCFPSVLKVAHSCVAGRPVAATPTSPETWETWGRYPCFHWVLKVAHSCVAGRPVAATPTSPPPRRASPGRRRCLIRG